MRYRKLPVEIEALVFNGENYQEIKDFIGVLYVHPIFGNPIINTLEGDHLASKGDYIIKGVKGEFYPCKPEIFEMTYEPVNESR